MSYGLPVWPRTEVSEFAMEDCKFLTPKKFCQSKSTVTMLFSFFFISTELCTMNFYFLVTLLIRHTTWKSWKGSIKNLGKVGLNCLPKTHGFCTMTMCLCTQHYLYSPDLALCNFFLFQKLKETPKGRHFDNQEQHDSTLKAIPHTRKRQWHRYTATQEEYSEGDHSEACSGSVSTTVSSRT